MIPVNGPDLSRRECDYVADAVASGWITSGRYVTDFEHNFAAFCEQTHGVSCSSGTNALWLALKALELPIGSRVAVPAYTCNSVANAVVVAGHIPMAVDIDPWTWGIDVDGVRVMAPQAVVLAHTYGVPARDTRALAAWCQRENVPLIEDGSEAHGATLAGKPVGSFGRVSVFSCRGEKLIGAGQMGICVTSDEALAERLRYYRDGGRVVDELRYWSTGASLNLMASNVTAALACAQLSRFGELVAAKRRVHGLYQKRLSVSLGVSPVLTTQSDGIDSQSAWWLTAVTYDREFSGIDPRDLCTAMRVKGIECRPPFYPMHRLSVVGGPVCQEAERLFGSLVVLPSGGTLTEDEVDRVVATLMEVARG